MKKWAFSELHLVQLNLSIKCSSVILGEQSPDFLKYKPLLKWQLCVLKDCSDEAGEPLAAMAALELVVPVAADVCVRTSTERAYDSPVPTLLGDEVTTAPLGIEMLHKRNG